MQRSNLPAQSGHSSQGASRMTESGPSTPAASQHRRNDESWVEISSQPSSSSLSSIGGDEIVTTGLRVGSSAAARRRRLQQQLHQEQLQRQANQQAASHPTHPMAHYMTPGNTSSQEEYDESESEEDRVMSSSAENLPSPVPRGSSMQAQSEHAMAVETDSEDDDDENATALAMATDRRNSTAFRPQPNAFSHPPAHLAHRSHSTNSSVPTYPHRPVLGGRSHTRGPRGGPPNFMSPHYQADNDAALRASLTTLLSCAAAARGLPKAKEDAERGQSAGAVGVASAAGMAGAQAVGPSNQPVELLLVPESELMAEAPSRPASSRPRTSTTSSLDGSTKGKSPVVAPAAAVSADKGKRSATTSGVARAPRATKKKKTAVAADDAAISPNLMTWVFGAGVVVLVSVVGFGAGYVIGREVGKQEALTAGAGLNASSVMGGETGSCGREVIRSSSGGLRRLRWGTTIGGSVAA